MRHWGAAVVAEVTGGNDTSASHGWEAVVGSRAPNTTLLFRVGHWSDVVRFLATWYKYVVSPSGVIAALSNIREKLVSSVTDA